MTDFYIVGAGVVPVDRNPERIACVLCGDAGRHRRLETVIGPVCGACFEAAAPESAPYYADWQRAGERDAEARERQRRRSQQATRRKVVRL
jgi:hypothetical protein